MYSRQLIPHPRVLTYFQAVLKILHCIPSTEIQCLEPNKSKYSMLMNYLICFLIISYQKEVEREREYNPKTHSRKFSFKACLQLNTYRINFFFLLSMGNKMEYIRRSLTKKKKKEGHDPCTH